MNDKQIAKIMELHRRWLTDEPGSIRADLQNADLRWADLRNANLIGADLSNADLRWADLRGADLRGADLIGADLSNADLRRADLRRADLSNANLIGADLRGADLIGANLIGANLDFAAWPLWCGTRDVIVDMKLVRQLLAHIAVLECDDPEFEEIRKMILPEARKFYRAENLGLTTEPATPEKGGQVR